MKPEDLLKRLLEHFYVSSNGGLEWSYLDGVTIREVTDDDFELSLIEYLDKEKADVFRKVHLESSLR